MSILSTLTVSDVANLPMNNEDGRPGLRAVASALGIKSKGVKKAELVALVETALPLRSVSVLEPLPLPVVEAPAVVEVVEAPPVVELSVAQKRAAAPARHNVTEVLMEVLGEMGISTEVEAIAPVLEVKKRNDNHMIVANAAEVAILVDEVWYLLTRPEGVLTSELCATICAHLPVKAGTIVSRLATQQKGLNVRTSHAKDAMNRVVTSWHAAEGWTQEAMAKGFLKAR